MTINDQTNSSFIMELLNEARVEINPRKISLYETKKLPVGVDAQIIAEATGDFSIYVKNRSVSDYTLSHQILHILAKEYIPSFVNVLEPDLIGMIGTELQGYLEHNWILAEQKRRGLEIDEFSVWDNIQDTIGQDEEGVKNFKRIMIINNIIRTFPEVLEKNYEFFREHNPRSLACAERIMSNYPNKHILSNYEAKQSTVRAIKEWKTIFVENGLNPDGLALLISVTAVFSQAQLEKRANLTLGLIPNVVKSKDGNNIHHAIYTQNDGQCCGLFQLDEDQIQQLNRYLKSLTLGEFLGVLPLPFYMR